MARNKTSKQNYAKIQIHKRNNNNKTGINKNNYTKNKKK